MEIISVNITKGGCGKTTTVQILGEIIGKKNEKRYYALILIRNAISQQFPVLILRNVRNTIFTLC